MGEFRIPWIFAFVLLASLVPAGTASGAGDGGYRYFLLGSAGDVSPATSGGLALMGGGTDVDAAFRWMIAKSGGGDFVVLRTSGSDGYNPYVRSLGGVDSAETLMIEDRAAASDPFVVQTVRDAEAVFFAGGDQREYLGFWRGTPLETALQDVADGGAPVGGTSAGLAILGDFVYSAENGTVYSREALSDPYNRYVTLEDDFLALPNMTSAITDTHFSERNRMGRLVAFLGRLVRDGRSPQARGIGVDEGTAVLVEPDGDSSVVGRGSAYFVRTPGAPQRCEPGTPLLFKSIPVYRASRGDAFHLGLWTGRGGASYALTARDGELKKGT